MGNRVLYKMAGNLKFSFSRFFVTQFAVFVFFWFFYVIVYTNLSETVQAKKEKKNCTQIEYEFHRILLRLPAS